MGQVKLALLHLKDTIANHYGERKEFETKLRTNTE